MLSEYIKIGLTIISSSVLSVGLALCLIKVFVGHMLEKDRDAAKALHETRLQEMRDGSSRLLEILRQKHDEIITQQKLLNDKLLAKVNVVTPKQVDLMLELYESFDDSCRCIENITAIYKPVSNDKIPDMMKIECEKLCECITNFTILYRKGRILIEKDLCDKIEQVLFGQKYVYNLISPAIHSYWSSQLIQNNATQWAQLGMKIKKLSEELVVHFRLKILN